jgi:hypothetical protein
MRKLLTCSLMMLIVFAFFGCSVRSMYIIRNASKVPVEVILILKGVKDSIEGKNFEIAGAGEIIPLKKSDLYTAFVNKIAGTWDKSGACHFQVPAGWSADITRLLERLNPGRDASADFMGSALEIKNGNSILVFGNNVAEVHRVFEAKSFFLSGPLVYYLDLE